MKILLFKSITDDKPMDADKFHIALTRGNFSPVIIPTLAFNFRDLESLREKLQDPEKYSGVIFSSSRCVEACKKALQLIDNQSSTGGGTLFDNSWRDKYSFAVGSATTQAIVDSGIASTSSIVQSVEENAESLGHKITELFKNSPLPHLPLLYPCGNLKRDILQSILTKEDINVDMVLCYETIENENLQNVLSNIVIEPRDIFVYFSPSGVNFTMNYVKDLLRDRRIIAIGPTTEEALLKLDGVDINKVYKCSKPSSEALLAILNTL